MRACARLFSPGLRPPSPPGRCGPWRAPPCVGTPLPWLCVRPRNSHARLRSTLQPGAAPPLASRQVRALAGPALRRHPPAVALRAPAQFACALALDSSTRGCAPPRLQAGAGPGGPRPASAPPCRGIACARAIRMRACARLFNPGLRPHRLPRHRTAPPSPPGRCGPWRAPPCVGTPLPWHCVRPRNSHARLRSTLQPGAAPSSAPPTPHCAPPSPPGRCGPWRAPPCVGTPLPWLCVAVHALAQARNRSRSSVVRSKAGSGVERTRFGSWARGVRKRGRHCPPCRARSGRAPSARERGTAPLRVSRARVDTTRGAARQSPA